MSYANAKPSVNKEVSQFPTSVELSNNLNTLNRGNTTKSDKYDINSKQSNDSSVNKRNIEESTMISNKSPKRGGSPKKKPMEKETSPTKIKKTKRVNWKNESDIVDIESYKAYNYQVANGGGGASGGGAVNKKEEETKCHCIIF